MNVTQPEFRHVVRIWWAFAWRSILITMAAGGVETLLESLIQPILGATGFPVVLAVVLFLLLTVSLALAASIYPIYSIIGKDFGPFRLVLAFKDSSKDVFHPPPRVEKPTS